MQKYKQLEDLGVDRQDCYQNWMDDVSEDDKRLKLWKKQKEEYGIDERETWNWSDEFLDYIYIHLEMLNRLTMVDYSKEDIEFNGEKLTVQDAIDILLKYFETEYYPDKYDKFKLEEYEDDNLYWNDLKDWCDKRQLMVELFARISMHLNW